MNRGKLMVELCKRMKLEKKNSPNSSSKGEKTDKDNTGSLNEKYIVIEVNELQVPVAQEESTVCEQLHEDIIIENNLNMFAISDDNDSNIIIYDVQNDAEIYNEDDFEENRLDPTYIPQNDDMDSISDQEHQSLAVNEPAEETPVLDPNVETTPTKSAKRSRFANENSWKRNILKQKRLSGESYINRMGRNIPKKMVRLDDCKCRFKCRDAISIAQQNTLFQEYWSFRDAVRQKDFLCSLIEETCIVRKRKRFMDSGINKFVSRFYKLPNGNCENNVRVCQKFFCNTFAISKRITNDALLLRSSNGTYSGKDKRKGRPATNATAPEKVTKIKAFLAEFPKIPSHYCRQRSSRLYLPPDLSIEKLYSLYKDREGAEAVSSCVFRRLFKEHEPPLAIFKPKKDQCSICNEAERTKTKDTNIKYQEHVKRRDAIKVMKEEDKKASFNNEKIIYGTFDLQAVLTLPYAGDCQIYYKRKLSLYNFTVFDSREEGHCFLWDETNGKKGSAEISTCLLKYIDTLSLSVEHLVLYADTCGGQNRNQNVLATMLYAVNRTSSNLLILDLKFMESGHSYLEADSIHATIERARKSKQLYSPNEYKLLIEMSRKRPFPYIVHHLSFNEFVDAESLNKILVKNKNKSTTGDTLNWLKVKWFRFQKNSKVVGYKYVVEEEFKFFEVNPSDINWEKIVLKNKYKNQNNISIAKKRDLISLLKQGVIPQEYAQFYNDPPSCSGVRDVAVWCNENEKGT